MSSLRLDIFALTDNNSIMARSTTFATGEYYHLYNRGADKRKIFLDKADHERFISLLYLCNSGVPIHRSDHKSLSLEKILSIEREATLIDIGAYCLMPNHFHILAQEKSEGGISIFMQKLGIAYSMYFNKRHERRGTLFEGTFRAEHASRDEYLKYLFAYIHLNPIGIIEKGWKEHRIEDRKKAEAFLESYRYSSYLDYHDTESRAEKSIINTVAFPEYFEKKTDFDDYIQDWVSFDDAENT
jgi:putative transposase